MSVAISTRRTTEPSLSHSDTSPAAPAAECQPRRARRLAWAIPALLFAATLAAYLRTMHRSFDWLDNSEFITAAYHLGIGHNPGYPTFMLIGHAFSWLPIGTVAYRLNLMDAVLGALAVALLYLVSARITHNRVASVLAALTLAFSYTFWDQTTEADVFTLHACFILAIVLLFVRWRQEGRERDLYLAWLIAGISLGNHALMALMLPAFAALMVMERGWRYWWPKRAWLCAGALATGAMVYLYIPLRAIANPPPAANVPHTLRQFWELASAPGYHKYMFNLSAAQVALRAAGLARQIVRELGPLGAAAAALGIGVLARGDRKLAAALILMMGADILYALNYDIFDIYAYFVPTYLILAIFLAVGITRLLAWGERGIAWLQRGVEDVLTHPRRIAMVAIVLTYLPVWVFAANLKPVDASQDYAAEDFARNAFDVVEPGSVVIGDWWSIAPLGYLKYVEGLRPDVTLSAALSSSNPEGTQHALSKHFLGAYPAAYIVEYQTSWKRGILERYPHQAVGDLVRLYPDGRPQLQGQPASSLPACRFAECLALIATECKPARVPQGRILRVTHRWRKLGALPYDVETLTALQGNDGCVWRVRSDLGNGRYSTQSWQIGEEAAEEHVAFIPSDAPPGEYSITVRARRKDSHTCLPMFGPVRRHPFEATTAKIRVVPRLPRPAPATLARRHYR